MVGAHLVYMSCFRAIIAALPVLLFGSSHLTAQESVYITRYATAVVPRQMVSIPIKEGTSLELCHSGEGRVSEGTLLARLDAEELALEETEMLNRQRQNRVKCDEALLQLRRQKEELEFILSQPEGRRKFMESRFKTRADERALALLNEKIALQEESTRIANEKLQRNLDKVKQASLITMPFEGRVQFHVTVQTGSARAFPVTQSGMLLTAIDDSELYLAVEPGESEIVSLAAQQLHLRLDMGGGRYLTAPWHHQKVELRNRRECLVYYFRISSTDREVACNLLGTNTVAELYYTPLPDEIIEYVHKAELAAAAGNCNCETWEELVQEVRPDSEIIFTGETHLCLKKKR